MASLAFSKQVQDHLLELDAVAFHWWEVVGQLDSHSYALALELTHGKAR